MKIRLFIIILLINTALNAQEIANRIPYLEGDKYRYANPEGEVVIPAEYDEAWPFCEGAAKVLKGGFYGLISENRASMVPVTLEGLGEWREGLIDYSNKDKYGFYNTQGIRVISAQYIQVSQFYEGKAMVMQKKMAGYINKDGITVCPMKIWRPQNFTMAWPGLD